MTQEDFNGLPEDDVAALRQFGIRRTYGRGEKLFSEGERPRWLMIIERGEVELVHEMRFERPVVQILHAGATVDQLAILPGSRYRYSALALNDATVLRVRLDTVRALEELFPEIAFRWLRLLAHTLERAHQRLAEMSGKSALEQVSRALLDESAERRDLTVALTQAQLAARLALSRQTVSRTYHELAREGAIKPGRSHVLLLDTEKLRRHLPR